MHKLVSAFALPLLAILATSCGNLGGPPTPNPDQVKPLTAEFVNPYPPGTYENFTAEPSYRKTYKVYRDESLLSQTNGGNSSILVNLSTQRAQLMNGEEVAMDYPISSGKRKYRTPAGSYRIIEKLKDKRSNLYGKIYDANGTLVKSDADTREDKVPEGGKYVGASMPYWMRMTNTGIGHHVGRVPRYAASHGCIRGPRSALPTVFSKVKIGTPVVVVE